MPPPHVAPLQMPCVPSVRRTGQSASLKRKQIGNDMLIEEQHECKRGKLAACAQACSAAKCMQNGQKLHASAANEAHNKACSAASAAMKQNNTTSADEQTPATVLASPLRGVGEETRKRNIAEFHAPPEVHAHHVPTSGPVNSTNHAAVTSCVARRDTPNAFPQNQKRLSIAASPVQEPMALHQHVEQQAPTYEQLELELNVSATAAITGDGVQRQRHACLWRKADGARNRGRARRDLCGPGDTATRAAVPPAVPTSASAVNAILARHKRVRGELQYDTTNSVTRWHFSSPQLAQVHYPYTEQQPHEQIVIPIQSEPDPKYSNSVQYFGSKVLQFSQIKLPCTIKDSKKLPLAIGDAVMITHALGDDWCFGHMDPPARASTLQLANQRLAMAKLLHDRLAPTANPALHCAINVDIQRKVAECLRPDVFNEEGYFPSAMVSRSKTERGTNQCPALVASNFVERIEKALCKQNSDAQRNAKVIGDIAVRGMYAQAHAVNLGNKTPGQLLQIRDQRGLRRSIRKKDALVACIAQIHAQDHANPAVSASRERAAVVATAAAVVTSTRLKRFQVAKKAATSKVRVCGRCDVCVPYRRVCGRRCEVCQQEPEPTCQPACKDGGQHCNKLCVDCLDVVICHECVGDGNLSICDDEANGCGRPLCDSCAEPRYHGRPPARLCSDCSSNYDHDWDLSDVDDYRLADDY